MSRISQRNYLLSNFTSVPMARPLKIYSRKAMLSENKYKYRYQKEKWSYETSTAGLEELLHGSVLPQVGQKMHPSPLSITLGWEHCPGTECSARSAMSSARPAGSFPLSSAITALCQGYRNHCQIKCFDFTPCKTAWRQCILCWLRCLCQSPFPTHSQMQLQRGHWQDLSERPVCSGFNGVLISLNIEVLFLQGPCVYGEHQQKAQSPK